MLELQDLRKTFIPPGPGLLGRRGGKTTADLKETTAIDGVSLRVVEGELFTLLGPSGCGKTTTLRSVAGLETPDSGVIRVAGEVLFSHGAGSDTNVPANRRGLGMVFQSYAIWPHMSVFENAAFPLRVRPRGERLSRTDLETRVMRVLETMELAPMAGRPATKLSGGQQQRLALARAMVVEPALLLLDEPLSNLDARLRETLRFELLRLQHELGITSIYVTHDQVEAMAISSRIAVMSGGRIMQVGTPDEIYLTPANRFVAEFIGKSNIFDATIEAVQDDGSLRIVTSLGPIIVDRKGRTDAPPSEGLVLAIRPESVVLSAPDGADRTNAFRGVVIARSFLGDSVDHIVRVGDLELLARSAATESFPMEAQVTLSIDPAHPTLVNA
jgi:iron(III) transport system ATP-binding protein